MQHWTATETDRILAEADAIARRYDAEKAERLARRDDFLRMIDAQMLRSRFQPEPLRVRVWRDVKADPLPWCLSAALLVGAVLAWVVWP